VGGDLFAAIRAISHDSTNSVRSGGSNISSHRLSLGSALYKRVPWSACRTRRSTYDRA
jgi:hypothetical protein